MKVLRKTLITCLVLALLVSFAGCAFGDKNPPDPSQSTEEKVETEEERAERAMRETPSGKAPGLYNKETGAIKYGWDELIVRKLITVKSNYITDAVKYLNGDLYIPNGIYGIAKSAFSGCTGIAFVSTGNGVTTINSKAFYGCTDLTAIDLGTQITNIDSSVFACCTKLQQVIIPNSVTNIGQSAFSNCTGLSAVYVGDGVTNISKSAFSGCTGLSAVRLGKNITYIGTDVFKNCEVLSRVEYSGTDANWGDIYIEKIEKGNSPLSGAILTNSTVKPKELAPLAVPNKYTKESDAKKSETSSPESTTEPSVTDGTASAQK